MADSDSTKEYEYHILTGKITLIVTGDTLKLKAGDTVYCKGFGKYLSGKYYINDITRTISSSGFTTSATLIRMSFGESLKTGGTVSDSHANRNYSPDTIYNSATVKKATTNKTIVVKKYYTVQKGDTLWTLAVRFYGDGTKFTKIANANNIPVITKNGKQYCNIKVGQKLLIP